jgi:hypothetical protein
MITDVRNKYRPIRGDGDPPWLSKAGGGTDAVDMAKGLIPRPGERRDDAR